MSWLSSFFKPKQQHFMAHMIRQAEIDVVGLQALSEYMKHHSPEYAELVNKAEKEADEVRRLLVDDLNRTFVTPMDREDIYTLSRAIDDLIDYAHTTVEEMEVLGVIPDEHLCRMTGYLLEAAQELLLSLRRLEDHPNVAYDHARKAKRVENEMEKAYRKAVADLFAGPAEPANIVAMLKKREFYRHLSNAGDRADEAANVISNIIVKAT